MSDAFTTHGAFSWAELITTDAKAAAKFYADLLGWTMEEMPQSLGEGTYTVAKNAGRVVGGIMDIPPQAKGAPPAWGMYITVDDVDAVAAKVEALGGSIKVPPMDIPNVGRFCWIVDPQGAVFAVITYNQP